MQLMIPGKYHQHLVHFHHFLKQRLKHPYAIFCKFLRLIDGHYLIDIIKGQLIKKNNAKYPNCL